MLNKVDEEYPHFVFPRVYLIGCTGVDLIALKKYLQDTEQIEFLEEIEAARIEGLNDGEILCSFYAKACYASLTNKKNKNITKTRAIADNIKSILDSGHGSVIEHVQLNFMITNCSRVFTHELVRHRVGVAFSQTSGRYVRSDVLNVVIDPILEPAYDLFEEARLYLEGSFCWPAYLERGKRASRHPVLLLSCSLACREAFRRRPKKKGALSHSSRRSLYSSYKPQYIPWEYIIKVQYTGGVKRLLHPCHLKDALPAVHNLKILMLCLPHAMLCRYGAAHRYALFDK